jgi:Family of unknown function (DUF6152)
VKKVLGILLASATFVGFSASAHHSVPAYFDMSKVVTITGTLKEFKFQNPHSIMVLEVQNPDGQVIEWKAEASLAAWLLRNGWTPEMFPAGEKLTLTGNPARDVNAKMIRLFTVTLPDGRKLNANNGSPTS